MPAEAVVAREYRGESSRAAETEQAEVGKIEVRGRCRLKLSVSLRATRRIGETTVAKEVELAPDGEVPTGLEALEMAAECTELVG